MYCRYDIPCNTRNSQNVFFLGGGWMGWGECMKMILPKIDSAILRQKTVGQTLKYLIENLGFKKHLKTKFIIVQVCQTRLHPST